MDAEHEAKHRQVAELRQKLEDSKYANDKAVQMLQSQNEQLKRIVWSMLPPQNRENVFDNYGLDYP